MPVGVDPHSCGHVPCAQQSFSVSVGLGVGSLVGGGVEIGERVAVTAAAAASLGGAVVASTWAAMKALNAAVSTRRATTALDNKSPLAVSQKDAENPDFAADVVWRSPLAS